VRGKLVLSTIHKQKLLFDFLMGVINQSAVADFEMTDRPACLGYSQELTAEQLNKSFIQCDRYSGKSLVDR
jgi:hypothetical protein